MRTILEIYFGINLFFAGASFCESSFDGIKTAILFLLFGTPMLVFHGLVWSLSPIWKWLDKNTKIPFYFMFYVQRKFDKMSEDRLYNINYRLSRYPEGKAKERWRSAVNMVNKLNNYKPE